MPAISCSCAYLNNRAFLTPTSTGGLFLLGLEPGVKSRESEATDGKIIAVLLAKMFVIRITNA